MNNIRIGVGSMTYAIKLRKLLLRSGINSSQVKWIENGGCIHGVEFDERNLYAAIAILRENDMDYTVNGTEK